MATLTQPRKSSKPKSPRPEPVVSLCMGLDHQVYGLTKIRGIQDPNVRTCWRLEKKSDLGCVYDVAIHAHGGTCCTCPDWETRHFDFNTAGCKHIKGLVALGLIDAPKPVSVRIDEPAAPVVPEARHDAPEPTPIVEPAPEPAACCDDAAAPCGPCQTIDPEPVAGPAPYIPPEPAELGIPADDDDQAEAEWRRGLPTGPEHEAAVWKSGFDAGRELAEDTIRDLEMTVARLEAALVDARAELMAIGRSSPNPGFTYQRLKVDCDSLTLADRPTSAVDGV